MNDILTYEIPLGREIVVTNVDGELWVLAGDFDAPVPWGHSLRVVLTAEEDIPDNVIRLFP